MKRKSFSRFGLILLAATNLVGGCSNASPTKQTTSPEQLKLGERVYIQQCASCHGPQGQGQYPDAPTKPDSQGLIGAPPHDATGHTWHHPDGLLINITRNGLIVKGFQPMPAFGKILSNEEIDAVLNYIKLWWKPEQVASQATVSARYTPPPP